MFVMPILSSQGVMVNEPTMLNAFLKNVIATNVWPTSYERSQHTQAIIVSPLGKPNSCERT